MSRVATYDQLGPPTHLGLDGSFRTALVRCLSDEDACSGFNAAFSQHHLERRRLLNRIVRDLESGPRDCHFALAERLFSAFSVGAHRTKQSCAAALFVLTEACPQLGYARLLADVLSSPSVSLRRQGHRSLRHTWQPEFLGEVLKTWDQFRDPEAFELLAREMPQEWLAAAVDDAFVPGVRGRILARAAIRLAPTHPEVLERLFELSPASWAYSVAKLGGPFDVARLRDAFRQCEDLDDRSLVIWSIGQLRGWDLLLELHKADAIA